MGYVDIPPTIPPQIGEASIFPEHRLLTLILLCHFICSRYHVGVPVLRRRTQMKNRRSAAIAFVLVLSFVLPGLAKAQESVSCSSLVDQMFAVTGLTERIQKSIDEGFRASQQSDDDSSEDFPEYDQFVQAASQSFAPESIVSTLRTHFLQHCDKAFLQSVIEQLQSSAVQPVLLAERHSVLQQLLTPEVHSALKAKRHSSSKNRRDKSPEFEQELSSTPASDQRIALMNDLDRALKLTDTAVELDMAGEFALNQGAGSHPNIEENDLEITKARMRSAHRKAILKFNLFTYRNLTDDQLRAFLEVSSQKPLREFNIELNEYLRDAIQKCAFRFGERIRALALREAQSEQ
jgi:hypothetical protein